jgi:hypothetical protein
LTLINSGGTTSGVDGRSAAQDSSGIAVSRIE